MTFLLLMSAFSFIIDRVTKAWALGMRGIEVKITPWLSAETSLNRGMSLSIGACDDPLLYGLVTCVIALVISWCCWEAYQRWQQGNTIIGLVLVITGALSNVIDRVLYGGVIDFIVVHYGGWYFPTFNCADILICTGVAFLFLEEWYS